VADPLAELGMVRPCRWVEVHVHLADMNMLVSLPQRRLCLILDLKHATGRHRWVYLHHPRRRKVSVLGFSLRKMSL
jgi:hypothetical protein